MIAGAVIVIEHYDPSPKSYLFCFGVGMICTALALREEK
jgi:hypothetical protein